MEKTYRVACSYALMHFAEKQGIIYTDWDAVEEFVNASDYEKWRNIATVTPPVHLYECTVKQGELWFESVLDALQAEEISCRHDYPIRERRVGFSTWVNECTNCKKELATFDKSIIKSDRRIKF